MACVWAFQPLPELNNALGFVECDEELAVALVVSGRAQDPRIGATPLSYITNEPPGAPVVPEPLTYDDKQMVTKRRK